MKESRLIILSLFLGICTFLVLGWGRVGASLMIDEWGNFRYPADGDVLSRPFEDSPGLDRGRSSEEDLESAEDEFVDDSDSSEDSPGVSDRAGDRGQESDAVREEQQERVMETGPSSTANIVRLRHAEENRMQIQVEDGEATSTTSAELAIEDHQRKNITRVRSDGVSYHIMRDRASARTDFPLSINLDTNDLIVSTPAGEKVVTVLPDRAVENMLAANVLDQVGGKGSLRYQQLTPLVDSPSESTPAGVSESTEAGTVSGDEESDIELVETKDGELAYLVPGIKSKKFLGFFDVTLDRVAVISAETGAVLGVRGSLFQKLVSILSTG